ncbi:la-related protein 6C [Pyrus ussuriensis x Pyrus communis]|uniref:La-related protein 6C n=1 Tax=Pyrus ussuriensis x Pyrus communis TaxID=2448454 RepID=A0A5N5I4L4_9ROSA|nr:la-related protein 6C [Pyrus ussuriensis x Pyrus communis]
MAHAHPPGEKTQEVPEMGVKGNPRSPSFKFNAQAPEFVPRSHAQMPISGYFYPCFHFLGDTASPDWFYVEDQELPPYLISNNPNIDPLSNRSKNAIPDDLQQKIIKQVEYQFSDMSLLANESLAKHISKDPEGFVPISVVASTKKMKSLISNNHILAQALRSSLKLVVNEDGKKVRRKHPFTEKDKEELQSRTVVAENLPEDHSHQNLEKIFSVVGSVKTIRICHPHESNSSRSKGDFIISNKLHALVEYETTDITERAVEKLSDERNWRKGLRVRMLLRRSPKSVLKNRKSDFDGILEDEEPLYDCAEETSHPSNLELVIDSPNGEENSAGSKKGWAWGRGKGRGRGQSQSSRGLIAPSPLSSSTIQCESSAKQNSKGPRMPDGSRGFTMGRGKPVRAANSP